MTGSIVSGQAVAQHAASTSDYIAVASVLVALIGVIVAVVAALYAKRSADATDEAVDMARTEHQEFLAQLRRRARFSLTLDVEGADADGEIVTQATTIGLVVRVGLTNVGEKAAGQTTMRVLLPRGSDARWVGTQTTLDPEPTTELLGVRENEVEASYIEKVLPQVGRRDNPVAALSLGVRVPSEIPIRFRAAADELADDDDAVIDRLFVVRRAP
jgi:hypothetical protein